MPARRRFASGRAAFVALVAAGGVALGSLPASAAPETPVTSQQAAALVGARGHDLEVVTEQFNTARVQLDRQRAAAGQAADRVVAAEAAVVTARDRVREVARGAYTGDRLSTLQAMLTSTSAGQLLDRMGTLGTIAQHNNTLLGAAERATADAEQAKAVAQQAAAAAAAQVDRVAAQQAGLQAQIQAYQADYTRLSAEEQARARAVAEQHAAASPGTGIDRSASAASRSSRTSTTAPTPPAPAPAPVAPAPAAGASGAAQTAVATALAQKGKPYVWAAAGPGSFDCSGLVQYAFAAAGISAPHSAEIQATMGRAVSRAELQPGDLVAFYSPVSHIGIYIGNGQMVHAPTSGDVVKVTSIDVMGSITAMRRLVG